MIRELGIEMAALGYFFFSFSEIDEKSYESYLLHIHVSANHQVLERKGYLEEK